MRTLKLRSSSRKAHPALTQQALLALAIAFLIAAAFLAPLKPAAGQSGNQVDLLLVLGVDCSWSVDSAEFALQRHGLATAFRQPEIIAAIQSGPHRRIAVTVVQWADFDQQAISLPWTLISNVSEAEAVADAIAAMPRQIADGPTSITAMMKRGAALIVDAPYSSTRGTIDIASDGRNNRGGDPRPVRDLLAANGFTINGLAIRTEIPTLDGYFRLYIIGGPGHFVEIAEDYQDFPRAIARKLLREITPEFTS